jgi:hypothetical protein
VAASAGNPQPTPGPSTPPTPVDPGGLPPAAGAQTGGLAITGSEVPWGVALAGGFLLVAGGLAFALRSRGRAAR